MKMSLTVVLQPVASVRQSAAERVRRGPFQWLGAALLVGIAVIGGSRHVAWAQEAEVVDDAVMAAAGALASDADTATWEEAAAWEEGPPAQGPPQYEATVQWETGVPTEMGVPVEADSAAAESMVSEIELPLEGEWAAGGERQACAVPEMGGACCEVRRWSHRCGVFGEFLFMRPRNADVVYAMPVDGPVTPPGNPANPGNQVGGAGLDDPDFQPGLRVGFERAWDDCSGIVATFTNFESSTSNAIAATPGDFIQSQVTHPGVLNAEDNWLRADATLDVDYRLIDVAYRWLVTYGDQHAVNLLAGARYGRLTEDFHSHFAINGTRDVDTQVQFEGAGLRLGFDAERYAACSGWMVYGRGNASFLAGDYRGSFFQASSFAAREIETAWDAGRIVSTLDLELGVGWTGPCDGVRLRAGYVVSGWLNAVRTDEWIDAVNANNLANLGGSAVTFDGFTASAEFRF